MQGFSFKRWHHVKDHQHCFSAVKGFHSGLWNKQKCLPKCCAWNTYVHASSPHPLLLNKAEMIGLQETVNSDTHYNVFVSAPI